MSYVRFDDAHEDGKLTQFCERLSGEVRLQTGEKFHIFQDRKDTTWGQQWKKRLDESLDEVTFLIPIITPGFFKSQPCRAELERFLAREERLGRGDLILPVYYVNCPVLEDKVKREADPLAKVIASRQYADWRDLRFEPFTSAQVGMRLAQIAGQIVKALERGKPEQSPAGASDSAVSRETTQTPRPTDPEGQVGTEQTPDVSRMPAQKLEPTTRVVDSFHRGH